MNSTDPSAREIGDLKIVSKVKSMFEVKPDDDGPEVRGKKSKPEPVAAPVAETNGLVDGIEEKNEEVKEIVVEEKQAAVVEEKPEPVVPVVEEKPEEKSQPDPVPEETAEEKHVTFNEEKPAATNGGKPESENNKEETPAKKDDGEPPKETNQNQ